MLEKRFAECSWEEWFSHDDDNYCSEKFSVMLKETMSDLIPVKTLRVRQSSLPWLRNPELIEARRKRDFAHRKALKVQSNEAWNDFRSCRNKVNKMLRLSKKAFYNGLSSDSKKHPQNYWKCFSYVSSKSVGKNVSHIFNP